LQNRLIQTSQTGGQWYNDTSPFSIPCTNTLAYFSRASENLTTFSTGRIRTRPRRPRKHCRRRAPRDKRRRRIRRRRRRVVSPSAAHLRRRAVEGDRRPLAARPGSRKVRRRKYWRQREDSDQDCPVLLDCSGYWLKQTIVFRQPLNENNVL
jgi:hypothetical protein